MLWTIFVILLVLWLLGVVSSYTLGGFIHVLLIVAVILGLVGYSVMKKGIPPVPTESIDSMRRDIQAIKGIGKRSTT